jgi:hypothetical protein
VPQQRPQHLAYGGRRILTIAQAAARYGLTVNAMHKALARLPDVRAVEPPPIDRRTRVYYLTDLDLAMPTRPGKGANLRGGHWSPGTADGPVTRRGRGPR